MMATFGSLQLGCISGVDGHYVSSSAILRQQHRRGYGHQNYLPRSSGLRSNQHVWVLQKGRALGQGAWGGALWSHLRVAPPVVPQLQTVQLPIVATSVPAINPQFQNAVFGLVKIAALVFTRSAAVLQHCPPLVMQSAPGVGLILFSVWGLGPSVRLIRRKVFKRNDRKWLESQTHNIMLSYMRPVLLWIGIILICRAFDPVVLATQESHAIKQRFVNFVQSLATVLAFAFCTASLTQQVQKFMMDNNKSEDSRNVGIQFIGNSIYASVWVAAVCLFMELLGFSTQKWITAGGFGTVLLTLAGREIFTNFLSSVMIHATRPFVENEWIQTKIEGQEVSGTVEVSTSGRNQVDWVHSPQSYELKGDPQRHAKSLSFTAHFLLLPLFQLFVVAPTCQEFSLAVYHGYTSHREFIDKTRDDEMCLGLSTEQGLIHRERSCPSCAAMICRESKQRNGMLSKSLGSWHDPQDHLPNLMYPTYLTPAAHLLILIVFLALLACNSLSIQV